jgi:hypothetical protein
MARFNANELILPVLAFFKIKHMRKLFVVLLIPVLFVRCQKENGADQPVKQPKVGTEWTYTLKKYNAGGGLVSTTTVTYTISSEQTIGSEKWFVVKNNTGDTVHVLKQKTDGLHQYQFGAGRLLCKDPAFLNETYNTENDGNSETFLVKAKDYPLNAPFGPLLIYYYEGKTGGVLRDVIWYNSEVWFAKKETYKVSLAGVNYMDSRLEITDIDY